MTRIAIMALEGLEEETPVIPDTPESEELSIVSADNAILTTDKTLGEISDIQESKEEGIETQETLTRMAAAPTPEEGVAIATEHLLKRVGANKTMSLESYKTALNKKLIIAQEGIGSRLVNSIKLLFTSRKSLGKNLDTAYANLLKAEPSEGVIEEPGYGRTLSITSGHKVSASQIVDWLKSYEDAYTSDEIIATVKTLRGIVLEVNNVAKQGGTFFNDDKSIAEMYKITSTLQEYKEKIQTITANTQQHGNDPDLEKLPKEHAKQVYELTTSIYMSSNLEAALDDLENSLMILSETSDKKSELKIYDNMMKKNDLDDNEGGEAVAIRVFSDKCYNAASTLIHLVQQSNRTVNAIAKYMNDSCK